MPVWVAYVAAELRFVLDGRRVPLCISRVDVSAFMVDELIKGRYVRRAPAIGTLDRIRSDAWRRPPTTAAKEDAMQQPTASQVPAAASRALA